MPLSSFARRFTRDSGIIRVMEDLGWGLETDTDLLMLGGGNPAHIPEVQDIFRRSLQRLLDDPARFGRLIGDYGQPQGDREFIEALADFLRAHCGWSVTADNIVLSHGSQGGFFLLFNLLAGDFADGSRRRILLPAVPEYIGYSDIGISDDLFYSFPASIEKLGSHEFKYHIDVDALEIRADTAALCVSRPTNPSGNVLPDETMQKLHGLARRHGIPLIIDSAYGAPFPHILYTPITPIWDEHVICCMSLSKLGLPGVRTGIIVASRAIAQALTRINTVIHLANGNFGPALVRDLLDNGELLRLGQECIGPYYRARADAAVACIHRAFAGLDYYLHRPEGAFFLWLWLPGLPMDSEALYQAIRDRGVLVLPGQHFFPGLERDWPHQRQCLRLSYATVDSATLETAVQRIAEVLRGL